MHCTKTKPAPRVPGSHPFCGSLPAQGTMQKLSATAAAANVKTVIKSVIVAETGPFSDQRGQFNDESLASIVAVMKANDASTNGTKCNFGHFAEVGAYVGRLRSPRLSSTTVDGATVRCVRADLHISPAAGKSPLGNLAEYISDLAAEDDRALMLSLVINPKQIPVRGEPPIWLAQSIAGCDLVDDGAATSSLLRAGIPERQDRLAIATMRQTLAQLS